MLPSGECSRGDTGIQIPRVQITEALAWKGCNVTQFIRRPQWVHIRDNPHSTLLERILLRLPFFYRWRQRQLWKLINDMDQWRLKPGKLREAYIAEWNSHPTPFVWTKDPAAIVKKAVGRGR